MEILDLINRLKDNNIDLSLIENDLQVSFDGDEIPAVFLLEIRSRKNEIVDFLKMAASGKDRAIPIIPVSIHYPLSSAQRRLWVLSQFKEANIAYNMPGVYIFDGDLRPASLEYAFEMLIRRHESLRTVFKEDDRGEVRQFVRPFSEIGFGVLYKDLRTEKGQGNKVERLVLDEAARPFDLASGPLLRAGLYRLEDRKWLFTYTMHHIVSDGWSMDILIKDLLSLYKAHIGGGENPLPPLRIQYKDYSFWQQGQLSGDNLQAHKDYWMRQLGGDLPVLHLPGDKMRPAVKSYQGGVVYKTINKELIKELREIGLQEGGTLFMGLLTIVNVLLYRYTGQEDMIIGTPIAGREHLDLEDQIGVYLNTLALRARFKRDNSFREVFGQLKKVTLEAYEHQVYPFDELVDGLELKRDMARNALFDIMVLLQTNDLREEKTVYSRDFSISQYKRTEHLISKFDLTFIFFETSGDMQLSIEYNSDIYEKDTIDRLGEHLVGLLQAAIAEPFRPVKELDYLNEGEKNRLLYTFNDTKEPFAVEKTIVDLFEEQVNRTPDHIAVIAGEAVLTFKDVNAKANQLGDYLAKTLKIRANDRIGIRLPRNEWMLITMIGILKSGGAYVPIDPAYPEERISYMIADSQCGTVIDSDRLREIRATLDKYDNANKEKSIQSSHAAYCIYTSGSTGKPKGCLLSHRNVISFFTGMNKVFGTEPGTMLSLTNYTFDISVLELIWTLTLGYKVIIQRERSEIAVNSKKVRSPLDFSLFYFGNAEGGNEREKYKLLLEGAKYADKNGYCAVWTPERHFHEFGGLYPSPAVTGAALATITENISIRAGSVVLPLNNPLRIAEEWSVIDNLSGGRAGISCASGWHSGDFVLSPENYQKRHEIMFGMIDTIRKLWKGESIKFVDGNGLLKATEIFPKPLQKELPLWVTSANSIETFISAGKLGVNILTHLLGESVEGLALKINAYRKAYAESGYDIGNAKVALMLHTYIGQDMEKTYEKARRPFINYLRTSIGLLRNLAAGLDIDMDADTFTENDLEALLDYSFQRYASSASLIGTSAVCMEMLDKLGEIGVNEIACLIDFGVDYNATFESLHYLTEIKAAYAAGTIKEEIRDDSIAAQLKRYQVTHLQATPSLAMLLKADVNPLGSLEKLLLGGERLPLPLTKELYGELPKVEIYNMYGPTETTIWSACCKIDRYADKILIGKPIANTKIYILDEDMRLLPIGAEGEIYIGGEGVGIGYVNKPDLTGERFPDNPFLPGTRFYRTGDFGKWLADGNIEYIGRKDDQVKVRGYRIELGEIEKAIQQTGLVESAVVISLDGSDGEKEIAAYVTSTKKLDIATIRSALSVSLPGFMIPSHYMQLGSLPLTPNGKLDKKRLPDLRITGMQTGIAYAAPRNEPEEKLVSIWREILGKEKIGIRDNFFELGGNSLKVARLASRINKEFNVRIGFRELFTEVILEEQARLIQFEGTTPFATIPVTALRPAYPLSSSQHRLWVLSQFEENNISFNMPGIYVFEGELALTSLQYAIDRLIQRHESLRTVFVENEQGEINQQALPPENTGFSMQYHDLRQEEPRDKMWQILIRQESIRPFNLSAGPLLRVSLYQVADDKWMFLYVMHHIISDGWSMGILIKELLLLYSSHVRGREDPLIPLRIQYKDYASWQQMQLNGESLKEHRDYWLKQFGGKLPVLELPSKKGRPAIKTYNGGKIDKVIGPVLSKELKSLCRRQGSTLFMGLSAVVNALLFKYTRQKDIIIGSPTAGREHIDLENQIGFYVNTLALRTRFKEEFSFNELIRVVKETTLGAYSHQVYPFDALVDELAIPRDISRNVLFDVWLVLNNMEGSNEMQEHLPDRLKISYFGAGGILFSKFDLLFSFTETGDELNMVIEYNTDILSGKEVTAMGQELETIILCVTEDPEIKLFEIRDHLEIKGEQVQKELLQELRTKNLTSLKNKK